jgi:hypothetical protein
MAVLSPTTIDRAGEELVASLASATGGGDSFVTTGKEFFVVKNGGGGSINVTFAVQSTVDGQSVASKVVAVAAGAIKGIGPFNPALYGDGNQRVQVTYSGVTSVTVGVYTLASP